MTHPRSAFGELALAAALPFIGYYTQRDQRLTRALSLRPDEDEILIMTGTALQMVGRSTESIPLYEAVRRERPFTAGEYYNFIVSLWNSGRLAELDEAINDAASLYPNQGNIWYARVGLAMYAGEVDSLAAILADKRSWPSGVPEAPRDWDWRWAMARDVRISWVSADISSAVCRFCSSTQCLYSISNAATPARMHSS